MDLGDEVRISNESARGCGFRKKGGIYLVSDGSMAPCGRLPIPLTVCPCCNNGIKPARAWTWVDPRPLMKSKECPNGTGGIKLEIGKKLDFDAIGADPVGDLQWRHLQQLHAECPLANANLPERAGLLWIGEKFYPRPEDYMREAGTMGISRRIPAVPRGFKLGDAVMLAHRFCTKVAREPGSALGPGEFADPEGELFKFVGGIFTMFRPSKVEYILKGDETDEAILALRERGLSPVIVQNPVGEGAAEEEDDDEGSDGAK